MVKRNRVINFYKATYGSFTAPQDKSAFLSNRIMEFCQKSNIQLLNMHIQDFPAMSYIETCCTDEQANSLSRFFSTKSPISNSVLVLTNN